ncbi:MAG TPA: hypothetical protein VKU42_08740 [Candidatus Angelobacter sp.]|nr:hypothetical protein [Candidatus Angelobacter sp.]
MGFQRLKLILPLFLSLLQPPVQSQQSESGSTILKVATSTIDITLPDGPMKMSRQELLTWVQTSASTVSGYYFGHFPVPHLTLRIRSFDGSGIRHGVTYAKDGGLILISVGRETEMAATKDDWVVVHEMIHLAFPSMDDSHHWIEEGISTYVEPVARARAGLLPVAEVWRSFVHDMPKGEPGSGDQGLDNTHTWGRTYWGGGLFCLVADVRIREHTKNRMGLEDALFGILQSGGTINDDWDIEKALTMADKATGTTVMRDLYHETKDKPAPVDLEQLWQKLGIEMKDGSIVFNDKAPEADIRKAITTARPAKVTAGH